MADNVSDLLREYTSTDEEQVNKSYRLTGQMDFDVKIKLEFLARHLGIKKTPLYSDLAVAAINEAFFSEHDNFDERMKQEYFEEQENFAREEAFNVQR